MPYYYVYKITDKKRKKYYIGSRQSQIEPQKDLGNIYFSSSANKNFIAEQKREPNNFIYEIVDTFSTMKEAENYELELLKQTNALNSKKYYNGRTTLEFASVDSRATKNTVAYLANLIQLARKERGISQEELAVRINSSRSLIARLEAGNTKVAIGTVFEVCFVLGIPLLGCDKKHIHNLSTMLAYMNRLIPSNIPNKIVVKDDF